MVPFKPRLLMALLAAAGLATSARAQSLPQAPVPHAIAPAEAPTTLTGKERLGRKWTDEQRLDNCNVPVDKRGPKPRPSACGREAGS
jgi:hypothetical protein